ncbi:RNA-directed DNA polymerase, eukaryota [Tanacetum coccineum]
MQWNVSFSPGPDGFTFEFFWRYWSFIAADVIEAVECFFLTGYFPRGCNSSFIALIPKLQEAKHVKDFRLITFVADRQILDGPFILNELISWCKSKKSKAMIFKVDFEKAYESVLWDYLDDILNKFSQFQKGLKQGDPLSPFLFIIVMESLHISFSRALNAGLFSRINIGPSLKISHLFYADDAIFIGEWKESNLTTIVQVLKCFYLASGLKINMQRSKLMGIGVAVREIDQEASFVGCSTFKTPFYYLGVMVGGSMSRIHTWDDVINKISSRLSKLKLKTLSIGGRLTLLKSVLGPLPFCHMSIFKVPMGVLEKMEAIRRIFFIGAEGQDRKMMWEKGRLYALETSKQITIANKLRHNSIDVTFRRMPRGGAEYEQHSNLSSRINSLELAQMQDHWYWSLMGTCIFSVKSVRNFIDDFLLVSDEIPTRWVKMIPIKVNVFAWRVRMDKLPTRLNLSFRGMEIPSILCPICDLEVESISHLLFSCSMARDILSKVFQWWSLDSTSFLSYEDWLSWFTYIRISKQIKSVLEGVFYVTWCQIWRSETICCLA